VAELKYQPVKHEHGAFLKKAFRRRGFAAAYQALEIEYAIVNEMLSARLRAGLTQDVVAARMGTTKSAISRLEACNAGRRAAHDYGAAQHQAVQLPSDRQPGRRLQWLT
jgi:hypothetical protein